MPKNYGGMNGISKGRSYGHKAGSGKSGYGYVGGMPNKQAGGYVSGKGREGFSKAADRLSKKKV